MKQIGMVVGQGDVDGTNWPEAVKKGVRLAKQSDLPVLLLGATGTGKSTLARLIHDQSLRRFQPMVVINLASLHEGTFESELFGHERGAFTGADQRRMGRLEQAQGGTVFLDEIGELTLKQQARFLEFLQTKRVCPLGSNREVIVNVRVIAATHRNLEEMVLAGTFREDLFHRLRFLAVKLPLLAEMDGEQFDGLVHQTVASCAAAAGKEIRGLSEQVASMLEGHAWPGNFREFRHVMEYAVLSSEGGWIQVENLPDWFVVSGRGLRLVQSQSVSSAATSEPLPVSFKKTVKQFERDLLERALIQTGGRVNRAARAAGLNKTTLIRRMKEFGMRPERFYPSESIHPGLNPFVGEG